MIFRPDLKTLLLGLLLDASSFSIHFLGENSPKKKNSKICVKNLKSNKSLKFFSGWLQLLMLRNIWLEQNGKHGTSNAQEINSIKLWSQTVKLLKIYRHIH
jgi:hypothetical protein